MWHRRQPRGRQQCLSRAPRPYPPGSPATRSPAGKRVNPPSPPYFQKSSYASTGFFFACGTAGIPGVGSNASPGLPDPTRQVVRPRAVPPGSESIPPHRQIVRRARTHVRAFFRMWHRRHPRGRQQCLSRATRPYPPGSPATRSTAGKRVNPPSPPYFKKSSYACTGFFSHVAPQTSPGSAAMPLPGYQTVPAR